MNIKCHRAISQSSNDEKKVEGASRISNKTVLVGKTNFVGFPFSREAENLIKSALLSQRILAFPTETFYGLGGNAFSANLFDRIYTVKGRSRNKPLLLLITPKWLPRLCKLKDSRINDLIDEFWPGPLTLILPVNPKLPEHLQSSDRTLAVRYTSSPVAQRLIELGDCPLIGTSANLTGMPECTNVKQVVEQLKNQLDLIIDGGELLENQPSTIVNCSRKKFKILRHGAITSTELNLICEVD